MNFTYFRVMNLIDLQLVQGLWRLMKNVFLLNQLKWIPPIPSPAKKENNPKLHWLDPNLSSRSS